MNKLLTKRVAIYVCSDSYGHYAHEVAEEMSQLYGGATTIDGVGYYDNGYGGVVNEAVTIVYSFTTNKGLLYSKEKLKTLALGVGRKLGQESVAIELDGKMEILEVEGDEEV